MHKGTIMPLRGDPLSAVFHLLRTFCCSAAMISVFTYALIFSFSHRLTVLLSSLLIVLLSHLLTVILSYLLTLLPFYRLTLLLSYRLTLLLSFLAQRPRSTRRIISLLLTYSPTIPLSLNVSRTWYPGNFPRYAPTQYNMLSHLQIHDTRPSDDSYPYFHQNK